MHRGFRFLPSCSRQRRTNTSDASCARPMRIIPSMLWRWLSASWKLTLSYPSRLPRSVWLNWDSRRQSEPSHILTDTMSAPSSLEKVNIRIAKHDIDNILKQKNKLYLETSCDVFEVE
nr:MAG TPA: hypothetical protein [Caudoviricetes sp.]